MQLFATPLKWVSLFTLTASLGFSAEQGNKTFYEIVSFDSASHKEIWRTGNVDLLYPQMVSGSTGITIMPGEWDKFQSEKAYVFDWKNGRKRKWNPGDEKIVGGLNPDAIFKWPWAFTDPSLGDTLKANSSDASSFEKGIKVNAKDSLGKGVIFPTGNCEGGSVSVKGRLTLIYAGGLGGLVESYRAEDRSTLWSFRPWEHGIDALGQPNSFIEQIDSTLICAVGRWVYGLDANSGRLLFRTMLEGENPNEPWVEGFKILAYGSGFFLERYTELSTGLYFLSNSGKLIARHYFPNVKYALQLQVGKGRYAVVAFSKSNTKSLKGFHDPHRFPKQDPIKNEMDVRLTVAHIRILYGQKSPLVEWIGPEKTPANRFLLVPPNHNPREKPTVYSAAIERYPTHNHYNNYDMDLSDEMDDHGDAYLAFCGCALSLHVQVFAEDGSSTLNVIQRPLGETNK